jgi:hypothetical protein
MLGHCLTWLGEHGYRVPASAIRRGDDRVECKVLQFRLARRGAWRPDLCAETLDTLEAAYSEVIDGLLQSFGSIDPAHS